MASWHIPLHESADSRHGAYYEDTFEEMLDLTFPPMRYLPMLHERPVPVTTAAHRIRRESSRERERLYRELVGHDPYVRPSKQHGTGHEGDGSGGFRVHLDVKHYKPDEITLKVEGHSLNVRGYHHNETEGGFEKSEFQRHYTIPETVDPHSLTSKITQDGILCIEAASKPEEKGVERSEDHQLESLGEKFQLSLDVSDYQPDEISIKVVHHKLIIHGETKNENMDEHGQTLHHKQFTRHFSIPGDINVDALASRYNRNGKMTIEAPRIQSQALAERQLEISQEVEDETALN